MKGNKGFTLIEMLAAVSILAILISMASLSYASYLKRGKDKSFKLAVNSFEDAAQSAFDDCASGRKNNFCTTHKMPTVGGPAVAVSLIDLELANYIDPIKSPYDTSQECVGTTYVTREAVEIKHEGAKIKDSTDDSNIYLKFKTCLQCDTNHYSEGCSN